MKKLLLFGFVVFALGCGDPGVNDTTPPIDEEIFEESMEETTNVEE